MKNFSWKPVARTIAVLAFIGAIGAGALVWRGFRATTEPTAFESTVARAARNLAIPHSETVALSPVKATPEVLGEARDIFNARCATCHGGDADGHSRVGHDLYPRAPDLHSARTQGLTDGELHYIIENGVQLTGMPAWGTPHQARDDDPWKLVAYIRSLKPLNASETAMQRVAMSAHYVGSKSCEKCHASIYARWQKTPMANIVRDPREHPEAIIPNLATNTVAKFTIDQVALVYGQIWKQRYFTKVGDDYFPLDAQWDVGNKVWRPYLVKPGASWWAKYYGPTNLDHPTGPTCDGCHSVNYDTLTKKPSEWNVGCERCHGPGSEHIANPVRSTVLNPAHMNYVDANDTCIQCHSQGQPLTNPHQGKYFDWPVGYSVGKSLHDYWKLDEHALGDTAGMHFADGTASKNRMQGNDFVQSVMYRRGVTCFSCHDVHGTDNFAQLRKPANKICLDCHGPLSPNGPRTATLAAHTHHKDGSAGSECIACHMPKIQTQGIPGAFVRAHTFGFITPAMTEKYGIPNACTSCHTEKSPAWAREAMRKWPEHSPWRGDQ
ncbi:MAG TPA: c-type cytochrome [Gemmatimonadaceae bacterium]|nr:c-type cytochrome [Gemmatimonadaceae bacterium]